MSGAAGAGAGGCVVAGSVSRAPPPAAGLTHSAAPPFPTKSSILRGPPEFARVPTGNAPGLMAGFVFGLLQLIFDGAYAWGWQSMLLDYLVAFTPLGLAGLFRGKSWGLFAGTLAGCLARFAIHYISGVTVYKILAPTEFLNWTFSSPALYSLVYNGSYMLPNTIITLLISVVLYVPLKRFILGLDLK